MPSLESILFNGYIYGTALWYGLRGSCRVYDADMVAGWFRPPVHASKPSTDLELYNIHTDGWCLLALAALLLVLAGSIPSSPAIARANPVEYRTARYYATAGVLVSVAHHVATGLGAWKHYSLPTHYNMSMAIGVWGNVWLTIVGVAVLAVLFSGDGQGGKRKGGRGTGRSGRKSK